MMKIALALLSVSDKTGLVDFARELGGLGIQLLSTGGTAKALREAGLTVKGVSEHTGFPEILDGRVKTLHPRIHAGILARHSDPQHQQTLSEQGIPPIGLVVVNLYPFQQTVAREEVTLDQAIEQIDIGGPSMVRAAAKNFEHVAVVVDPADYPTVVAEIKASGTTSRELRFDLARKAFAHTAAYDSGISAWLEGRFGEPLPSTIHLSLRQEAVLRYGENPHQQAALYRQQGLAPEGIVAAVQRHGKQLSFNNYLDLDAAWNLVKEFETTACAIIKHTNPCGAALGASVREAYERALECDPVSAFGSIIACNREVDGEAAEEMGKLFVEAVVAPAYHPDALEILGRKKNIRIMEVPAPAATPNPYRNFDFKRIEGGLLVQDRDRRMLGADELKIVTRRPPAADELEELRFAWVVCKHVKSNAIVYTRERRTLGIGAGQMSRVDSARIAADKCRVDLAGSVMASDAFFPFRDGLDEAAKRGIRAVIQPGGSVRDEEVIQAADEHDMAMVFTGIRHFRH